MRKKSEFDDATALLHSIKLALLNLCFTNCIGRAHKNLLLPSFWEMRNVSAWKKNEIHSRLRLDSSISMNSLWGKFISSLLLLRLLIIFFVNGTKIIFLQFTTFVHLKWHNVNNLKIIHAKVSLQFFIFFFSVHFLVTGYAWMKLSKGEARWIWKNFHRIWSFEAFSLNVDGVTTRNLVFLFSCRLFMLSKNWFMLDELCAVLMLNAVIIALKRGEIIYHSNLISFVQRKS